MADSVSQMNTSPLVSVCVISYCHAEYILECLKSISRQLCDFEFEVVVRDDASPDGTADIAEKFIRENGLSRFRLVRVEHNEGMARNLLEALRLCRGRYIALCEGDDYWVDERKLQLQVEAMQADSRCAFSIHPCFLHKTISDKGRIGFWKGEESFTFGGQDVLNVVGQFAPTASYMFRREVVDILPGWFVDAPIADFLVEMFSLRLGRGLYIPRVMSAYRVFSVGSWSDSLRAQGGERMVKTGVGLLKMHSAMNSLGDFEGMDFSVKLAGAELSIALGNLLSGRFDLFREGVERSFLICPRVSSGQKLFYHLRRVPVAAMLMLRMKRFVYRAFQVK